MKKGSVITRFTICVIACLFAFSGIAASKSSKIYDNAVDKMAEGAYAEASELFDSIGSYEDSSTLAMYCKAIVLAQNGQYEDAISAFDFFGDYKDCKYLKTYYSAALLEEQAKENPELYFQAADLYSTIKLFKDSAAKTEACKQAVYLAAVSILDHLPEPIPFDEANYEALTQIYEAQSLLKKLESYPDAEEELKRCWYEAGLFNAYSGKNLIAEELFAEADDYGNAIEMAKTVRELLDLQMDLSVSICDAEGRDLLQRGFTEDIYADDPEQGQTNCVRFKVTNTGEDCEIKVSYVFSDDVWSWTKRSIKNGEEKIFLFDSSQPGLEEHFKEGSHSCIWYVNDIPVGQYDYTVHPGKSEEKQKALNLVSQLSCDFYVETEEENGRKYYENIVYLSDLSEGETYVPVISIFNNTGDALEYYLSADINGTLVSWAPETHRDGYRSAFYTATPEITAGDYNCQFYIDSCPTEPFHFTVKENRDEPSEPEEMNRFNNLKKNDTIVLGHYEQDNHTENGTDPIAWTVLDIQDGNALLLSKYSLEYREYDHEPDLPCWENSSLRKWLNTDFMNTAFNGDEQKAIIESRLDNSVYDPDFWTVDGGNNTVDSVFLLSSKDVDFYFEDKLSRACEATDYVKAQGIYVGTENGNSSWWTRSHVSDKKEGIMVMPNGSKANSYIEDKRGIRPCIRVNLSDLNHYMTQKEMYDSAVELFESGQYTKAKSAFKAIGEFSDSAEYVINCNMKLDSAAAIPDSLVPRDTVNFGSYEQDNEKENGPEAISWIVLKVEDGKALLVSEYALDRKVFSYELSDITWESSRIRNWLNSTFLKKAFTDTEQDTILPTDLSGGSDSGHSVSDKVFLLSESEVEEYFPSVEERVCKCTEYAGAQGAIRISNNNCVWWLRPDGPVDTSVKLISTDGNPGQGFPDKEAISVRPAIWVELTPVL